MERRLTTILAADIAGFSRLVGADEEGTLAAQRAHRRDLVDPLLERHGGRIANTAGDSMLVEFPSAVEAVRCAVAVQAGMAERNAAVPEDRRILYRVGINVGDVVAEGADLLGDGVNVAARLEGLAPPSGIVLSHTVRDQIRDRLDLALADLGEVEVKNIARPVRAFQVLRDGETPLRAPDKTRRRWPVLAGVAAVLAILVAGGAWWYTQRPEFEPADPAKMAFALPDEPSIAVLPFDNLSGDPGKEFLADGITEQIITTLSGAPEMLVIARNSTFAFKGKPTPVPEIAERLGVRYVLEGSVQQQDDRLRVTVQLIDAVGGHHIWSEVYDREYGDLFRIQDGIARQILLELHVSILMDDFRDSDNISRSSSDELEQAVKYYEWSYYALTFTVESQVRARSIAREMIERWPDERQSNNAMGLTYLTMVIAGLSKDKAADMVLARKYMEASIRADPEAGDYHLLAWIDLFERKFDAAIENCDRALEKWPNHVEVLRSVGAIKAMAGQPEEGVRLLKRAIRRTPIGSEWAIYETAYFQMLLGDYGDAIAISQGLLASESRDGRTHRRALRYLAAMAIWEGDKAAARRYIDRLLEMQPGASVKSVLDHHFFQKDQAFLHRYADALRAAGLPETPRVPDAEPTAN